MLNCFFSLTFSLAWLWVRYWVCFVFFLGDVAWRKFYCSQLLSRCVPESQALAVVAAWNELVWNSFFLSGMSLAAKINNTIYLLWSVNQILKHASFSVDEKQAQDYACMTKAWLSFHTSIMFETLIVANSGRLLSQHLRFHSVDSLRGIH